MNYPAFTISNSKVMVFKIVEVTIFHLFPVLVTSTVGLEAIAAFFKRYPNPKKYFERSLEFSIKFIFLPKMRLLGSQNSPKKTSIFRVAFYFSAFLVN